MESNPIWSLKKSIASVAQESSDLITEIREQLAVLKWDEGDTFKIHLALEEAIMNAIKHGNQSDPDKTVMVDCQISEERFRVSVEDQGNGFVREEVPDPTVEENLTRTSGRGLTIMENFMTSVTYLNGGNTVEMVKTKSAD